MAARQQAYLNYYTRQAGGGGLNVFRGGFHQRGHGLGNILSSVFKLIKPLAAQGVKAIGRQALHSGLNAVQDVVQGVPVKQAMKRRATEGAQQLITEAKRQGFPPGQRPRQPPRPPRAPGRSRARRGIKGRAARSGVSRPPPSTRPPPRRIQPDIFG